MEKEDKFIGAKAVLDAYISSQNMRKTPEREAILQVLLEMEGHHSADEILTMMPGRFHVSRVTVYSTLQLFARIGLAYSHPREGATLYENAYNVAPHNHYICTECGEITDLYDSSITSLAMQAKTPRFTKLYASTYIYGQCAKCKAKIARWHKASTKLAALSAAAHSITEKKQPEDEVKKRKYTRRK
ncbi:MAG: transcriptional repressor [Bacteroidaceae bacterium]|jgi:Fur family ferric uptake transcriptional regulator|nr:transcriptional repressor [Bacteroidaceae bacterium]